MPGLSFLGSGIGLYVGWGGEPESRLSGVGLFVGWGGDLPVSGSPRVCISEWWGL